MQLSWSPDPCFKISCQGISPLRIGCDEHHWAQSDPRSRSSKENKIDRRVALSRPIVVHDFTTNDATMTGDPSGLRSTTIALGMITTSKVDRHRYIGTNPRKRKCLLRYQPGQYGSASSGSGWRIMHQHQQWSMVPRETEHVKKTRQCGDGVMDPASQISALTPRACITNFILRDSC